MKNMTYMVFIDIEEMYVRVDRKTLMQTIDIHRIGKGVDWQKEFLGSEHRESEEFFVVNYLLVLNGMRHS